MAMKNNQLPSPPEAPPPSSIPLTKHTNTTQYRPVKDLPIEVLDHITVCLEEQLFPQAFSLLANSLTFGTTSATPARIPPPQHLSLAATLVIHPLLTTRTTSQDKHAAADAALHYLKLLNTLIGPQAAGLHKALQFSFNDLSSSRRGNKSRPLDPNGQQDEDKPAIRSPFATTSSLWTTTEDFWSLLGWALNCSVLHPARWARYHPFLDFLLDVLSDDLESRVPAATKAYQAGGTDAVRRSLSDCMLARWLSGVGEGRNNKRRLMRAVLADGSKGSVAEFGEVWRGETKAAKKKEVEPKSKRRKLDLENGDYGDYDEDSDHDSPGGGLLRPDSRTSLSRPRRSRAHSPANSDNTDELSTSNPPSPPSDFGGPSSLSIRKRTLALLTRFTTLNPDAFLGTEDLFDLYTEFLRPLSLPIYTAFICPAKPWLGANSAASLIQMVLRALLQGSNAKRYDDNALTQREFEEFYAGFAGGKAGASEGARVGVGVEGLMRLLWSEGGLHYSRDLRRVVERGIKDRAHKAGMDGRRRTGMRAKEEEDAAWVLECSGERMMVLLDLVEADAR